MALIIPELDGRTYQQILDEALARIPVHNPEWRNFNDSDPGITILQLFAFMTDSLLYRSNLIPERNRLKFLKLLGVPRQPAAPAKGVVVLSNARGSLATEALAGGLPVFAGAVGFTTLNALDVFPVESQAYTKRRLGPSERQAAEAAYRQLYDTLTDDQTDLEYYETEPFQPPASSGVTSSLDLNAETVDGTLWLALLRRRTDAQERSEVRRAIAGKTLTIGLLPVIPDPARILVPAGEQEPDSEPKLAISVATGALEAGKPKYKRLETREDANPLAVLTLTQATLPSESEVGVWEDFDPLEDGVGDYPPSLEDEEIRERVVTWIRIRVEDREAAAGAGLRVRFGWVGINAARVTQQVTVAAEPLGRGTGEPDQAFRLVNTPVIPETVQVRVNGELWRRVEDLFAAPPEVPVRQATAAPGTPVAPPADPSVYVVDRESGEVRFGTGHAGRRPPTDAPIVASYSYGGGPQGNVGIDAISQAPLLPPGFRVTNPIPAWGGVETEGVESAERNIARWLRHRDRAVSREDFLDVVSRTPGVVLGRVEVLPSYHPEMGAPAPGAVTVLVLPLIGVNPAAPEPDRLFLDAICRHLEPRRVLTTEVHVSGPQYVGLTISIGIDTVAGAPVSAVREAVQAQIRAFLSPIHGGFFGSGWPLETNVVDRELLVQAARVNGVARVRQVKLWDSAGAPITELPITGLQLPRLDRIAVQLGDAEDLVAGVPEPVPGEKERKRVPVPVLPPEC